MNQNSRFVRVKCVKCGKVATLKQIYDTHLSEYVEQGIPLCSECWRDEMEMLGGEINDDKRKI